MNEFIDIIDEGGRCNAKEVRYIRRRWDHVRDQLPVFKTDDFKVFSSGLAIRSSGTAVDGG